MGALTSFMAMQQYFDITQQLFQCRVKNDDESRRKEQQLMAMETQMFNALVESENAISLRSWCDTYKDFDVKCLQKEIRKIVELKLQMQRENVSEQQLALLLPKLVALSHYCVLYVDRDMLLEDLQESI